MVLMLRTMRAVGILPDFSEFGHFGEIWSTAYSQCGATANCATLQEFYEGLGRYYGLSSLQNSVKFPRPHHFSVNCASTQFCNTHPTRNSSGKHAGAFGVSGFTGWHFVKELLVYPTDTEFDNVNQLATC